MSQQSISHFLCNHFALVVWFLEGVKLNTTAFKKCCCFVITLGSRATLMTPQKLPWWWGNHTPNQKYFTPSHEFPLYLPKGKQVHPMKTNIKPENGPLQEETPFGKTHHFQVPALSFSGVHRGAFPPSISAPLLTTTLKGFDPPLMEESGMNLTYQDGAWETFGTSSSSFAIISPYLTLIKFEPLGHQFLLWICDSMSKKLTNLFFHFFPCEFAWIFLLGISQNIWELFGFPLTLIPIGTPQTSGVSLGNSCCLFRDFCITLG